MQMYVIIFEFSHKRTQKYISGTEENYKPACLLKVRLSSFIFSFLNALISFACPGFR